MRRCWRHCPSRRLHNAVRLVTQIGTLFIFHHFPAQQGPKDAGVSTRITRFVTDGCSLRNKPHAGWQPQPVMPIHKQVLRITGQPVLGAGDGESFPETGSIRARPPGFMAAHVDPSEVSANQRTLSPPKPSLLVQVLVRPEPSMRANPKLVPTQRDPFLSRLIFQTMSEGKP